MSHLFHDVTSQGYIQTLACYVQAVIASSVFLPDLQRCVGKKPIHCSHLAEVAGSMKCSLAINILMQNIALLIFHQNFKHLQISIRSSGDEGSISPKIICIDVALLH